MEPRTRSRHGSFYQPVEKARPAPRSSFRADSPLPRWYSKPVGDNAYRLRSGASIRRESPARCIRSTFSTGCYGRKFALVIAALALSLATSALRRPLSAEDAAVFVAPQTLHAGARSSFTLSTFDAATRAGVDRLATVSILDSEGTTAAELFLGLTGSTGHQRVGFDVPALAPGTYTLRAQVTGFAESLETSTTLRSTPGVLIETDKPIYKPSQKIQGRVILVNSSLRPVAGEVEVTFHDGKGLRIDRRQLVTDNFGVAPFSLDLASELNFGTWKIRAESGGAEASRDVRVEEYVLPRYALEVDFEKSWALASDPIPGSIEARYFFGQDVEGTTTISAKRWVGVWEEYARLTGDFSGGRFAFELPAVGFVSGSPGAGGQGSILIDVEATDATGHTQTTSDTVTITAAPVQLTLIPRSRTLKPGIPARVLLTTEAPDGAPVNVTVDTTTTFFSSFREPIGTAERTIESAGGVAEIVLLPPDETAFAEIHATATVDGKTTTATTQVGSAWSPGGSFLSLARLGGTANAAVGEELQFSVVSTHPGTVYYEVYAAGRTVFSETTESDEFQITVTPEMVPRAKVVAYKINPDNEVAADSVSVGIDLALSVSVAASFNAETVRPGDPVEVIIDAGTGKRTLLGVSIVDNSVLALGRSRLHLAEVFAELERRFLEPQVAVQPGPGGFAEDEDVFEPPGGAPFAGDFFAPQQTTGALDTIREVGLNIATTSNIRVPAGERFGFLDFVDDVAFEDGPPQAAPGGEEDRDGGNGSAPPAVRVRQFFPETWVWEPTLLTDDNGRASLTLEAPDSITSWKLAAVSTCPDAAGGEGIGFGEADLTVFQDFFVEPSLPFSVTRGEEFPIRVDVFNYLDAAQTVTLAFGETSGIELTGDGELTVDVPPQSASSVTFPVRPTALGSLPLSLTATAGSGVDAVRRDILVVPEGRPEEIVINGVIEPDSTIPLDLTFPEDSKIGLHVIEGSARAFLNITPSPVAQTMQGVADLLGMPYGCGEQNMIFLAPDIEILKYLREIDELEAEIRATAEFYVTVGYQRQLTFQTTDGGFAAFGGEEGALFLTAFVLSTFSGAREVRDIDETVLTRAAGMLLGRQNGDGSFRTDDFLIHKELDGGLTNLYTLTAYVANALADYGGAEIASALQSAGNYLATGRTSLRGVQDDPYGLAIAAVALLKIPGFEVAAEATLDRLLELAQDEGIGIHWEPYPVETTGYAAVALLEANGGVGRPEANAAIDWLSTQRNSLGGYGESTQDTVVAIRSLFLAARKVRRDVDATLSVRGENGTLFEVHVDENNFDLLHQNPLPLDAGALELHSSGSGNVGYQIVKRFNVPADLLPPPRDMVIRVDYDASHIEVDDIVDVRVALEYTGWKEETGMVIADIGVPTGFAPVRSSLDVLIGQEELEKEEPSSRIERLEVAGRKVIFYVDGLRQNEPLQFTFQIRSLYPVRADGPISRVYEYYDAEVEAFHRQDLVTVLEPLPESSFVRGDVNADNIVDVSDPIGLLTFLFESSAENARVECQDAGDVDDDGVLVITDAVYMLNHLFLGGPAPRPPYPEAGFDTSEDFLRCFGR